MKKLCHHDISIHTNFNQNQSINECARKILVTLIDLWKICVFILLIFLKSFWKRLGVKQIINRWFLNFKITICDLQWPKRSYFILLRLFNVSIYRNCCQYRFINEFLLERKSQNPAVSEYFFVRCRKNYVLNKKNSHSFPCC